MPPANSPPGGVGFVHDPPVFGVPPKWVNRSSFGLVLHKVTEPLLPAFAAGTTVTVTFAVASTHGEVPVTR